MSSISNRINDLVNHFSNGNVSKFSAKIGFSEANVRNYINGTQPKSEFLSKLIEVFEINADWLLSGSGTMLKFEEKKESPESDIESKLSNVDFLKREIQTIRELLKEKDRLIEKLEPLADQFIKEMLERNKK